MKKFAAEMDRLLEEFCLERTARDAGSSRAPEATPSPSGVAEPAPLPILPPSVTLAQDGAAWVFIAAFAGMATAWATAVVPAWVGALGAASLALFAVSTLVTAYGRARPDRPRRGACRDSVESRKSASTAMARFR